MNIPYVAIRNLQRKLTRTWLLLAIVAIVSCTLFASTLFLRSIATALRIGTSRLGADILVVPENAETKARTALLSGEPTHFLMAKDMLGRVRAVDGVKAATPQLFIKPTSFTCCYNVDVFLIAYDPATDFTVKPWLEQNLKRVPGDTEIITGREVPVVEGDAIPFFGTNFSVVGTMEPTGMDFFDRSVFMSMESAYRMAENSIALSPQPITIGRDKISTVLVQVQDNLSPDRVAIRIEHDIPGVKAISSDTVISTVRKQLSGLIHIVFIISIVLWIIVLLIMAFAFTMIVNERRRELGLLRAMGATRTHVFALILMEAATLSAAGGAIGMSLGFMLLLTFKNLLLHYLKLPYLFPSLPDLIMLIAVALVVAVLTGIIAAFLPARSLSRKEPYEAIRSSE
ncbi:MAG: FtsX-like permease family protein [Nitrospirota bacterium]|nr:FtsX-like permease family protein [Nitrospirota bacterium]